MELESISKTRNCDGFERYLKSKFQRLFSHIVSICSVSGEGRVDDGARSRRFLTADDIQISLLSWSYDAK
jgi:hypothetical protein